MEQLLFESDREKSKTWGADEPYVDRFLNACSYKNNQMQEFIKWLYIHEWEVYKIYDTHIDYRNAETQECKSFSELFEIFIKETSK